MIEWTALFRAISGAFQNKQKMREIPSERSLKWLHVLVVGEKRTTFLGAKIAERFSAIVVPPKVLERSVKKRRPTLVIVPSATKTQQSIYTKLTHV